MTAAPTPFGLRGREARALDRWASALPGVGPFAPGRDDCGYVDGVLVSVDALADGVHFRREWIDPESLGWRLVAAALSDLAASRGRPLGAVLACSVPRDDLDGGWLDAVIAGAGAAARTFDCPLLGGDTTAADSAVLSATVLGRPAPTPLARAGAQPGDRVYLSGPCGSSAAAVALLSAGTPAADLPAHAADAWLRPRPRLDLVPALHPATAGLDVSDGLLLDAARLADASGVRLVLDRAACTDGPAPEHALAGGEDWQLLATSPVPLSGFREIGRVHDGGGLSFADGSPLPARLGFEHGDPS